MQILVPCLLYHMCFFLGEDARMLCPQHAAVLRTADNMEALASHAKITNWSDSFDGPNPMTPRTDQYLWNVFSFR